MTIGRILVNDEFKGSGFVLATSNSGFTRIALTANHVVRNQEAASLQFVTQAGRRIAIERVEGDDDLDVAVLHLGEDVPEGLAVGLAIEGAAWQVETQPQKKDPKLYGTITDTHRRFVKQGGGHEIYVLQLYEKQNLGDYKGYSGSPVVLKSPTDAVIGVLIEQLPSRLSVLPGQREPATNVLYAIPIQDVLERFHLAALSHESPRFKMSKKLIEEAKGLSNSNQYEEAIAAFDQAIDLDPNDAVAYLYKGLALLVDWYNGKEAVATFDQALRLDPTVTAINEFSGSYHDLYPHKASAYLGKGLALLALGRGREAVAAFDQAIDLNPIDAVAYLYKGCVLHDLECYEEALIVFDQAIDRDPTVAIFVNILSLGRDFYPHGISAHLGKGLVLLALKRYEEAVAAFDQALRLDPDNAAAHREKGQVLHEKLKRNEEALVALDQAVLLSPNDGLGSGRAYIHKGKALLALKRYEESVAAFDQALRIADRMATRASIDVRYSVLVGDLIDNAYKGKDEALLALKNNEEGHGSF